MTEKPKVGTVIQGTFRCSTLMKEFGTTLQEFTDAETVQADENQALVFYALKMSEDINEDDRPEDDPEVVGVLDTLMDKLDEIAPEGTYFGVHEDDASNFGFWPLPKQDK